MANCNNCGKKLGCSCKRRTLPNGKSGCVSCAPKNPPGQKKVTSNNTISGQILGVTVVQNT